MREEERGLAGKCSRSFESCHKRGRLVTPAPAPLHELVVARIVQALTSYLPSELARVFTRGSVEVEPNVHLEPDILVVPVGEPACEIGPETRWTAIRNWRLAVEVSGDGSRLYDRDHKTPAYLALGVREVWRADLKERWVFTWLRPGSARTAAPVGAGAVRRLRGNPVASLRG